MKRRAQATLEFTLAFVIIVALSLSLFIMWKWSTDNIVKRQRWYYQTRVEAGSTATPGTPDPANSFTVQKLTDNNIAYPEKE
jgi:hypothetical protein